jgi:hypothetical protein
MFSAWIDLQVAPELSEMISPSVEEALTRFPSNGTGLSILGLVYVSQERIGAAIRAEQWRHMVRIETGNKMFEFIHL